MTGSRYLAGSLSTSSISAERPSDPSGGPVWVVFNSAALRSKARRLAASDRARAATRLATPNSQLASESRRCTDLALRARTRNVAWNASSTS